MDSTPFADLDGYLGLNRVGELALSPDGERLVVTVSTLDPNRTAFVSSLWEVDPAGQRSATRLTWGPKSESAPAFLPDGSLIFRSSRPDPQADSVTDDDTPAALWMLPPTAGEARPLATRPGGIGALAVAPEAGVVVLGSSTFPSTATGEDDENQRKSRKKRKIGAILYDSYPIRYWDRNLGPDRTRLFVGTLDPLGLSGQIVLTDLTGDVRGAIDDESTWSVSADGTTAVVAWAKAEPKGSLRHILVTIDLSTGERRVLLDDPAFDYFFPAISPDGTAVALLAERRAQPDTPVDLRLIVLDLTRGEPRDAAPGWDRWPSGTPVWTPDGGALLVIADDHGRAPVWRIDLARRTATRLTADAAAYSDLHLARDGSRLYALRSAIDAPPAPVRLDPLQADQRPTLLLGPVEAPAVPGTVAELSTVVDDGTSVRAWLVLPSGAAAQTPAPLLVWLHGGPLGSWNAWSWRWNPWLAAAQGYAILLPDPALSTGYGLAAIRRGWGNWGSKSFPDVMAITDAAVARDDIDATRTAAMGGSFGGYLANWIAGHTDRFSGIVSHAGLWALEQFSHTTDAYHYWRREMTPPMAAANSPHLWVDEIRTPMLVIHGDRDYRVPVGEALRLWADLSERCAEPDGTMRHRLLLFPDEGHWVLKPQNIRIWYETVFAFLAHTVQGQPWHVPESLN